MNAPNDFHDDPRLTAYALGELEGAERAEVEALLAKDEAARLAVEEIRATAGVLATEFGREGTPALTELQRQHVAAKASSVPHRPQVLRTFRIGPVAAIAAASMLVGVTGGVLVAGKWTARSDERSVAIGRQRGQTPDPNGGAALSYRGKSEESQLHIVETHNEPLDEAKLSGGSGANAESKPLVGGAGGGAGGNGSSLDQPSGVNVVREWEESSGPLNPDLPAPENLPSGATGGTSIGVSGGHDGSGGGSSGGAHSQGAGGGGGGGARTSGASGSAPGGKPSAFDTRRRDGNGKGGGGLGQGGQVPEPAKPRAGWRGPQGEVPPESRSPNDPPPAPDAGGGPSTPGGDMAGGPTSGGGHFGGSGGATTGYAVTRTTVKSLDFQLDGTLVAGADHTTATYAHVEDNPFRLVKDSPLSTFGVDVDTASYSNVRRFLNSRQLPPPGAVRIEEMVNYFPYDYAPPTDGRPFAVRVDVAGCPWKTDHRLVRVGIKGKVVATAARPAANLVFLLDVSGSMQPANRLPLVIQSMKLLVGQLEARDRVAIVVYAGASGLALPSTSCEDKATILAALDALRSGGSTNGAAGIELAYQIAAQHKIEGGVNRVVLATDGDFNVGVTDQSSLVTLIQEKAKQGTFLSVLGVGDDNYKDATMEMLADKGNGNYAYIDTIKEGEKALVAQASGTLVTIAKDVKLQIEFNPSQVGAYRLIGYENRVLAAEDFKDDKKDAGEIGAGHTVTALYEIAPPGSSGTLTAGVEPLKYQAPPAPAGDISRELLTVKLRWKEPNADVSTPMEVPVVDEGMTYSSASPDFKFAASVAAFGMTLRNSPHRGNVSMAAILELATEGASNDPGGYRAEFVTMLKQAIELGLK